MKKQMKTIGSCLNCGTSYLKVQPVDPVMMEIDTSAESAFASIGCDCGRSTNAIGSPECAVAAVQERWEEIRWDCQRAISSNFWRIVNERAAL